MTDPRTSGLTTTACPVCGTQVADFLLPGHEDAHLARGEWPQPTPGRRITVAVDPSFAALADLLYGDGYADTLAAALTDHLRQATEEPA